MTKTSYSPVLTATVPVFGQEKIVYAQNSNAAQNLPTETVEILNYCQGFKPLEIHAIEISHQLNLNPEQIQTKLIQLRDAGVLISQPEFIAKLHSQPTIPNNPTQITSIGFPTGNRVQGLKRALTSYIENSQKAGRNPNFIIVDDSKTPSTQQEYQQMLAELKNKYQANIFYGGTVQKQQYAQQISKAGDIPQDIIDFALFDVENCGNSTGANRNALFLQTVGEALFSADDDTICQIAPALNLKPGIAFTAECDPADIWTFPDLETACGEVNFIEQDILALHEQLLGKNIQTIISEYAANNNIDLTRTTPEFLQKLQAGDGKILVSLNGLVGDCGWGAPFGYLRTPAGYLYLHGDSHQHITQSESFYRNACTYRNMIRNVNRLTISDDSVCQSAFIGYDNRDLLPPFMPVGRIQDNLFSVTLWQCFEQGFFGNIPAVALHKPVQKRNFWPGEIFRTASGLPAALLMIESIRSCNFGITKKDPQTKIIELGEYLKNLASMPLADFEEFLTIQIWHSQSHLISLLEKRLKLEQNLPNYWANDINKYIDILSQSLTREDYLIALDFMENRTTEENRQLVKRLVFKFGQLLTAWPQIITTAKALRNQEQQLAKLI